MLIISDQHYWSLQWGKRVLQSGEMATEPPPFQESSRCDVCKCSFSTFRRRVILWIQFSKLSWSNLLLISILNWPCGFSDRFWSCFYWNLWFLVRSLEKFCRFSRWDIYWDHLHVVMIDLIRIVSDWSGRFCKLHLVNGRINS